MAAPFRRLVSAFRRFLQRVGQTDEERLNQELEEFCKTVPDSVRIAEATLRQRVRLAGMVRRITVRPVGGFDTLGVVLADGTGEVSVRWMGRRSIDGLVLGSRLQVDGVLGRERGELVMVNPTFEFV